MRFMMFDSLNLSLISLLMPTVFAEPAETQCGVYLMRDNPPALVRKSKCVSPKVYNPVIKKPRPQPKPEPDPVYLEAWDLDLATEWSGDQLEGADPACKHRSARWNNPVVGFDINQDGLTEMLVAISCYQGDDPEPGEYHNRSVVGAWLMFCSTETGHYNCTQELFDAPTIRATTDDPWGGSPYTHVMQQPKDINGDGYPDFWYALNRDDGRPYIHPVGGYNDHVFERLCGPRDPESSEWDCTRKSMQTVILSDVQPNGDLKYQVVQVPWEARVTQAMVAVPNHQGGYDLLGYNYGAWNTARVHADNTVEDVTAEYQQYVNAHPALEGRPYAQYFYHEDTHYLVTADVSMLILENPDAGEWGRDERPRDWFANRGFTLWEWHPGVGFSLSDYYIPADQDRFVYTEDLGGGNLQPQPGAMIRGLAMYMPMWHFFDFVQLHPDDDPVLVIAQESATTAGDYLGATPDSKKVYSRDLNAADDLSTHLVSLNAVQAFYIQSGKLVARSQPVVEGDFLWNVPHFEFEDLNLDGFVDMYATGGNNLSGRVYLNDGTGTMQKVNMSEAFPELDQSRPGGSVGFVLNLGDAPYLDVVYWGVGISVVWDWMGDYTHTAPPLGIVPGLVSIDQFPRYTPAEINHKIKQCQINNTWMGQCEIH